MFISSTLTVALTIGLSAGLSDAIYQSEAVDDPLQDQGLPRLELDSENLRQGQVLAGSIVADARSSVLVAYDFEPGPSVVSGLEIPLGFSSEFGVLATGFTDERGKLAFERRLPASAALAGRTLYMVGAVLGPAGPGSLKLTRQASLTLPGSPSLGSGTEVDLVGLPRNGSPFFEWVLSVQEEMEVQVAIDPVDHPGLVGLTVDVYVTEDRDQTQWGLDPTLVDLTAGGAESITVVTGSVAGNILVVDSGSLNGIPPASLDGGAFGVGYDVVVDVNRDGLLDAADLIDGYTSGAGFHVVRDPVEAGLHSVNSALYTGGTFLGQELFWPSDIATLQDVPLVIVSHGNGHNYQWYDHIGNHLASHGYVVMSHQNDTMPGIETASTTTLTNTDYLLGNLDLIEGGVLEGRLDTSRITWIGHSRGGEGVARAYDRIVDLDYVPVNFTKDDIRLISSIAPTDFLGTVSSTPHDKNFHLWVGGSDSDVSGCVGSDITQSFHLYGRATNQRQSISLNGAGHGDFHNGGGSSVASGPCLIDRASTHQIMLGHILPLVEYHMRNNLAALDFLTRQYEDFSPRSVPEYLCINANLQFSPGIEEGKIVLENYQLDPPLAVARSVTSIETDLPEYFAGRYDDPDGTFTTASSDGMNGMSYCNTTDFERGAVLGYPSGADYFLRFNLDPSQFDWSDHRHLTFRMCQTTRNALTISDLADVQFEIRLTDADGDVATLSTAPLLAGIAEPYQRNSCGSGTGWGNEFETLRLPLRGFRIVEPALNLEAIQSVTFLFGASHGSAEARLGLDDIELTTN